MRTLRVALLAPALALAACDTPPEPDPVGTPFGEAVRRNILTQAVNPEAPAPVGAAAFDGDRALLAIDRYKADKVKQPEGIDTTDTFTGSGSGGGGEGGS